MVDSEKPKADVIQVGEIEVPIRDTGKKPMDIDASVDVPSKSRSWPMIMRPVAAKAQWTSTISLGGALQD